MVEVTERTRHIECTTGVARSDRVQSGRRGVMPANRRLAAHEQS
jgi:hypothetical protein